MNLRSAVGGQQAAAEEEEEEEGDRDEEFEEVRAAALWFRKRSKCVHVKC